VLLAILNCEQKYLEKNKKKVMVFSMCWVAAARDVVDLMAVESLETVHKIVERSWMGSRCITARAEYASDTFRPRCSLASQSNVTAPHLRCLCTLQQRQPPARPSINRSRFIPICR